MLTVYKADGTLRHNIEPEEGDIQNKAINGVDICVLNWRTPVPAPFQIGDYCEVLGETYTLNTRPRRERNYRRDYTFTFNFEGQGYKLGRVGYLFLDSQNRFTKSYFPLNAKPIDFLNLIIYNMNREFSSENWYIGNCIDDIFKTIQFDGLNCLEAINLFANEYNTEFLIEKTSVGNRVSLFRRESNKGIVMRFGPEEAILNITDESQDSSSPVNRLYAYGSDRNIDGSYRLNEGRLRLNGERFVEINIPNVQGVYERSIVFDDIYPHRTGTISSIDTPFVFYDTDIDFDLNSYLLPNEVSPKIVFLTGLLSGYTLDLVSFDYSTKKFTIKTNEQETSIDIPSIEMSPQPGDQYTIVDILMPVQYVVNAEEELRNRALQWLNENGYPKAKYTIVCNPFWIKRYSGTINLGDILTIDIPEMDINLQIRVISFNRNINKPYIYGLELADKANNNILVKVILSQN